MFYMFVSFICICGHIHMIYMQYVAKNARAIFEMTPACWQSLSFGLVIDFGARFSSVVRSVVAIFDKLKFSAYNHIDLDLDIAVRSLTRSPSLSLSLWCHHSPLPMSPPTLAGIAHLTISPFRKIDIDSSKRTLLSLPLLSSSFLSTAATNRCVAMCMCMCSHRKPFPRALR